MWWKILLIIFALIFLFFVQSVHIRVCYDGELTIIAGLGFIRLNVLKLVDKLKNKPKKEKPKKEKPEKEKKPEEEKPKEEKESKPNVFQEVWELRGVDGALDLLSEFASLLAKFGSGITKHFVIRRIVVDYAITGKDAADTAKKYGMTGAAIYSLLGVIAAYAHIKKQDVHLYADYTGSIRKQVVDIHISYRLLSLIAVALGAVKDFLQIIKREKSINARIKARSKQRAQAAKSAQELPQTPVQTSTQ